MRFNPVARLALALASFAMVVSGCKCNTGQVESRNGEIVVIWRNAAGERLLNRDATYDFGKALVGQRVVKPITLRNTGDIALTLTKLELTEGDEVVFGKPGMVSGTSTSAFESEFDTIEIGPSDQHDFNVAFTPKGLKAAYRSKLTLTTEGTRFEDATASITLIGNGEAGACDLPSRIDFGKVAVGETFPFNYPLNNPTSIDATGHTGAISGADATSFGYGTGSAAGDVPVAAMSSANIVFTFSPTEMREYNAEVVVHGAGECPDQTVTIHGIGSNETLTWSPIDINYGFVNPGSETLREVVFVNPAAAPITLTAVRSTNENAFYTVPTGTTFTVPGNSVPTPMKIACNPPALDTYDGTVTFQTGLVGVPMGTITLHCVGGGPRIKVTPRPTLAFGRVGFFPGNATFSVQRKVNIQNVGSRPVTMDPTANLYIGEDDGTGVLGIPFFTIDGPNADEFTTTFATNYDPSVGLRAVAGQNSIDVSIVLRPLSAGPKTAAFHIHSNDPAEPDITVDITADAQVPPPCAFTVAPSTANFGLVTPGTTKDLPINITNTSVTPGEICYLSGIDLAAGTNIAYSVVGGPIAEKELQPQETFQVVVRIAPTGAVPAVLTPLTGNLVINTSSGMTPQVMVPLNANIGPSCLTITPDPMNYGTVRVGCASASRTFNVYNTCSTTMALTRVSLQAAGGQPAGGPNCPGSTACPEFFLTSTPTIPVGGLLVTPGGSAPITFAAKYRPLDIGSDSGAIALDAIQNGQNITYLVNLQGNGDTTGIQVDTYTQDLQPKADILLVVDDSGSMQDKQNALAANFTNFIQYASAANVDYQIGVTTTGDDMTCFLGACPKTANGKLVTDTNTMLKIAKPTTPNVAQVFARLVNVGTNGSGYEKPLAMAVAAVTPPVISNENAGLIRTDANLAVVIISDASDQSTEPVSYYQNLLVNVKGFQRLSYFTFSAITPRRSTTPSGCQYDDQGAPGSSTSQNSQRYDPIVQYTGGVADEICNTNWATALQNLGRTAFGYRTQFYLNNTPDLSAAQVTVKVNNINVASGCTNAASGNNSCTGQTCTSWCFDSATNSVKFNALSIPDPGVPLAIEYTQACLQ